MITEIEIYSPELLVQTQQSCHKLSKLIFIHLKELSLIQGEIIVLKNKFLVVIFDVF